MVGVFVFFVFAVVFAIFWFISFTLVKDLIRFGVDYYFDRLRDFKNAFKD